MYLSDFGLTKRTGSDSGLTKTGQLHLAALGVPGGDIAAGEGSLWIDRSVPPASTNARGSIERVDPRSGTIVKTITPLVAPAGDVDQGIAIGQGAGWYISANGTIGEIDLRTNRATSTLPAVQQPTAVEAGDGAVWVRDAIQGRLVEIDPETRSLIHTYAVGPGGGPIAIDQAGVWVLNRQAMTVSRIDPVARKVTATIPVGAGPEGIAADASGVWVTR